MIPKHLQFHKTRIAPTPSGFLHLGNILSFAITAALAKKTSASILLRIDDFDMQRTNKLYVQDIFDTLNFLEIPWDEGPRNMEEYELKYSQVHRMNVYREAIRHLMDEKLLFACSCTRPQVLSNTGGVYPGTCKNKHLDYNTPGTSLRLDTANAGEITAHTLTGSITTPLPDNMHDFIVRKKDGFPAYQLISVMDDAFYGVDLVVRGDDLWPSTLAQLHLSTVLHKDTFAETTFYHHPLLVDADGNKLSKSAGATSVQYLRNEGKTPKEIYALIGAIAGIKTPLENWQHLIDLLDLNHSW